jgi:hypothetical protein
MVDWTMSDDGLTLLLVVRGRDAAKITRWSCNTTGDTIWWGLTIGDKEHGIHQTLHEACRAARAALRLPSLTPPPQLLEEHGEPAAPPPSPGSDAAPPSPPDEFRTGRRVPRNVYRGDEPVFMAATDHQARELVALLNAGVAARRAGA